MYVFVVPRVRLELTTPALMVIETSPALVSLLYIQ